MAPRKSKNNITKKEVLRTAKESGNLQNFYRHHYAAYKVAKDKNENETEMTEELSEETGERILLDNEMFKAVLLSNGEDSEGLPVWHSFSEANEPCMIFDEKIEEREAFDAKMQALITKHLSR